MPGKEGPILVSACLLGEPCRYDGNHKYDPRVARYLAGSEVVPVCPEMAGGLGTPRPACDVEGGDGAQVLRGEARVLSHAGEDKTEAFLSGAAIAAEAARRFGARRAILKDGSPSCGRCGVTTARLRNEGISVIFEEDL